MQNEPVKADQTDESFSWAIASVKINHLRAKDN